MISTSYDDNLTILEGRRAEVDDKRLTTLSLRNAFDGLIINECQSYVSRGTR